MKTLHVVVTEKDIERGVALSTSRCPVARAIDRLVDAEGFPHTFVCVGEHGVWLSSGGGPSWLGWLPKEARDAVALFDAGWTIDQGKKLEPFEFDLELHHPGTVVADPLGLCPDVREMLESKLIGPGRP